MTREELEQLKGLLEKLAEEFKGEIEMAEARTQVYAGLEDGLRRIIGAAPANAEDVDAELSRFLDRAIPPDEEGSVN